MKNPSIITTTKTMLATVALTGLMVGSAARVQAASTTSSSPSFLGKGVFVADDEKHSCKGKNSCKGQGGCKTSDNGCKGKNTCKGKGGCNGQA